MKIIVSLITVLLCALSAPAQCRTAAVQYAAPAAVEYQQQVVAAVFQPVYLAVPAYGVGVGMAPAACAPAAAANQPTAAPDQMKQILDELRNLRADVDVLRRPRPNVEALPEPTRQPPPEPKFEPKEPKYTPPIPQKISSGHPGQVIMGTRCASCHNESAAKSKGGGQVLFRNGQFIDEGDNLERAVLEMDADRMPKGAKLTGQEKYNVLSWLLIKPGAPDGKK